MRFKTKKALSIVTAFIAALLSLTSVINAAGSYSWYCRRRAGNLQPACPPEFLFIDKYKGAWLDTSCGDVGSGETKIVYLTFDAGYENGNVAKILDILRDKTVPGAFFVLSNLISRNPDLICRMADEGHLVCNHTSHHRDMSAVTDREVFVCELRLLEEEYRALTGNELAKYYRPPEGRFNEANLADALSYGYKTVFWSFAYADWDNANQMSYADAKKKILDNVHNGAVILLHPTSATNASILGDIIDELKASGYSFGTLDTLYEHLGM